MLPAKKIAAKIKRMGIVKVFLKIFLYPLRFMLAPSTRNVFYRVLGVETPADTPDRAYLEKRIFPYLINLNVRNILFAGVGNYYSGN